MYQYSSFIQATQHLMEELTKMQESLHGVRMKIKIADPKFSHPLLPLWKMTGFDSSTINDIKKDVEQNQLPNKGRIEPVIDGGSGIETFTIKKEPLTFDGKLQINLSH